MHSARRLLALALVTSMTITPLLGCGRIPTAPEAAAPTPEASAPVGMTEGRAAESQGLISGVVDGLVGLIVKATAVVGNLGASLTHGRWTVTIPAGAVDGTATVAIGIPSLSSPDCALEIWPADKNQFAKPVKLTADCRNVSSADLAKYVIYWYDPASKKWVEVPGSTVDLVKKTVSAPLSHFSRYAVGKSGGRAGW